jgi:hypothetical protein
MPFRTRPHWEDRQIVQYSGESITLSGVTKYSNQAQIVVEPTILYDNPLTGFTFVGGTADTITYVTGQTQYDLAGLIGYQYPGSYRPGGSGLIIKPPIKKTGFDIYMTGTTGTTTVDVTGFVLTAIDSGGTAMWASVNSLSADTNTYITSASIDCNTNVLTLTRNDAVNVTTDLSCLTFTGNTSGDCISDLYVSNIHSCSPLNINPLNEGDIFFGTLSANTFDLTNNRLGIGIVATGSRTTAPQDTIELGEGRWLGFNTSIAPSSSSTAGIHFKEGVGAGFNGYGVDMYYNATSGDDRLIIESKFNNVSNGGMLINRNTGNVGIGIDLTGSTAAATLHLGETGNVATFRYVDGNQTNGYVLTSDASGNATWQASTGGFTGNTSATCISDIWVSNIHSCSPLNINPLDEGNIYMGSSSGLTFDVSNSRVGIGTTTPNSILEVAGTTNAESRIIVSRYVTSSGGPGIQFRKARGTEGSPIAVQNGDNLLNLAGSGYNGSSFFNQSATIVFDAAENFSGSQGGTDMIFGTTSLGATVSTEKMRISAEDYIYMGISSGLTYDITNKRLGMGIGNPSHPIDILAEDGSVLKMNTNVNDIKKLQLVGLDDSSNSYGCYWS